MDRWHNTEEDRSRLRQASKNTTTMDGVEGVGGGRRRGTAVDESKKQDLGRGRVEKFQFDLYLVVYIGSINSIVRNRCL